MDFDLDREPLEEAGRKALELFVEIYRGLESRRIEPGEAAPRELAEAVTGALGAGHQNPATAVLDSALDNNSGWGVAIDAGWRSW